MQNFKSNIKIQKLFISSVGTLAWLLVSLLELLKCCSLVQFASFLPECGGHNELPPGDCGNCEIVLDRGPGVISVTTYT